MALSKYSAFNYGHTINSSNSVINFRDAGITSPTQYATAIATGSFTLNKFADYIATAMNKVGDQEYTVTLDRTTRKYTISAPNNFELLISSGTNVSISAFSLMGFNGADLTGSNSYTSDSPSGSQYVTQTPLKDFSDFDKNKEKSEAKVNTTPSGIVEVVSFSTLERMKCELPLITNFVPQRYIRETNSGVEESLDFLNYAIDKKPLEFIYDYEDQNNYVPCILDKTQGNSKGTGFELREKVRDKLPNYYEVRGLVFLKIEER